MAAIRNIADVNSRLVSSSKVNSLIADEEVLQLHRIQSGYRACFHCKECLAYAHSLSRIARAKSFSTLGILSSSEPASASTFDHIRYCQREGRPTGRDLNEPTPI